MQVARSQKFELFRPPSPTGIADVFAIPNQLQVSLGKKRSESGVPLADQILGEPPLYRTAQRKRLRHWCVIFVDDKPLKGFQMATAEPRKERSCAVN